MNSDNQRSEGAASHPKSFLDASPIAAPTSQRAPTPQQSRTQQPAQRQQPPIPVSRPAASDDQFGATPKAPILRTPSAPQSPPAAPRQPVTALISKSDDPPEVAAKKLKHLAPTMFLWTAGQATLGDLYGAAAYGQFVEDFLREAGNPDDPVKRRLLEAFLLAYFHVGQLTLKATTAGDPEAAEKYNSSLAKIMAEMRRLGVTIHELEMPASQPQKSSSKKRKRAV